MTWSSIGLFLHANSGTPYALNGIVALRPLIQFIAPVLICSIMRYDFWTLGLSPLLLHCIPFLDRVRTKHFLKVTKWLSLYSLERFTPPMTQNVIGLDVIAHSGLLSPMLHIARMSVLLLNQEWSFSQRLLFWRLINSYLQQRLGSVQENVSSFLQKVTTSAICYFLRAAWDVHTNQTIKPPETVRRTV
jgi:hypothetical protein